MKRYTEKRRGNAERQAKRKNDKDNYYLYRNFKDANVFGMIASIHTFGRDLKWNPHIHYDKLAVMLRKVGGVSDTHNSPTV
ncbi:MAG: hypothetical protein E7236_09030, partial [Lachnospiraceae bacterium]|nr:hypothetical protein [Lachnospiraceae bacterium]